MPKEYDYVVVLPRAGATIGFADFIEFRRQLETIVGPAEILLDLQHVEFAHPAGMAPIVAVIRTLTEQGWLFDVALPESRFVDSYFDNAGWVAGITGELNPSPKAVPGSTFIPLTRYETSAELNPIMAEALQHFTHNEVHGAGILEGVEWILYEVADNVLNHAGGVPGWIQLAEQPKRGTLEIVVVDCGQGISSSLREQFPEITRHHDLIAKAVEKGVTRDPNVGQGNGLAGTLRIAIAAGGFVNIYSGAGLLRYLPNDSVRHRRGLGRSPTGAAQGLLVEESPYHQGTVVSLTIPTKKPIDVAAALWGTRPLSMFEEHMTNDGREIVFAVAQEAEGFGNRATARPLRRKLHNLLNLYELPLAIDFDGVNLVSASFADELVARLVKEVGVATFFQRVTLRGMNDLVRRTMDAVLEQRLRT